VALVVIEKNEIRVALLNYHREVIDILEKYNYKIHEFDGELDYVANNIKQDMRNYPHKDAIFIIELIIRSTTKWTTSSMKPHTILTPLLHLACTILR